jgi:hypothetical protein
MRLRTTGRDGCGGFTSGLGRGGSASIACRGDINGGLGWAIGGGVGRSESCSPGVNIVWRSSARTPAVRQAAIEPQGSTANFDWSSRRYAPR